MGSTKVSIYPHHIACIKITGSMSDDILKQAFDTSKSRNCTVNIIDFSQVTTIQGYVLTYLKKIEGKVVCIKGGPRVQPILEMLGYTDTFPFYGEIQETLEKLMSVKNTIQRFIL